MECLDDGDPRDPCEGSVELRMALSPTGVPFPRCERHWDRRLAEQERIDSLYGGSLAHDWFDEAEAGERWGDDY